VRFQTVHPGELVVEFRTRLRVPVRSVERGDQHAGDGGLGIAGLAIARVARQRIPDEDRLADARQDRDAVPGG